MAEPEEVLSAPGAEIAPAQPLVLELLGPSAVEVAGAARAVASAALEVPDGPSEGPAARARFRIAGLLSAARARRIERHLEALPGVFTARIDDDELLTLTYLAPRWTMATLAVEAAVAPGIEVTPLDEPPPPEPRWRTLPQHVIGRSVLLASAGIVAGLLHHVGYGLSAGARAMALDVQAVLTVALVVWGARPLILGAARDVAGGRLGSLAMPLLFGTLAFALSITAFFLGDAPAFEASLIAIGGAAWLESEGTRLHALLQARLKAGPAAGGGVAHLMCGDAVYDLPADAVLAGDRFVVRAGDVVATDATVRRGEVALISGRCGPGARVAAGARIDGGAALLEARLDQQASAIAEATRRVVASGRADRWLSARAGRSVAIFALASTAFAVALFAALAVFDGQLGTIEDGALGAALAVLAAAAPIAVSRSRGLGLYAALARAAERGVAFKNPRAAARLGAVRELVFEKTGTLTAGRPRLAGCVVDPEVSVERVMRLTHELERGLDQPVARELERVATERLEGAAGGARTLVATRQELVGRGVVGYLRSGAVVRLGTRELLRSVGIPLASGRCVAGEGVRNGPAAIDGAEAPETVLYLAEGDRVLARFHLVDPVRPEAAAEVRRLRALGVDVSLITSDGAPAARKIAEAAGVARFAGDLAAPEARAWVTARRAEGGGLVGVVGDGFDDEEIQRGADFGVVMGVGRTSEADVVVAEPDLAALVDAVEVAREARLRSRLSLATLVLYTVGASATAAAVPEVPLWVFAAASVAASTAIGRVLVSGAWDQPGAGRAEGASGGAVTPHTTR